MKYTKRTTLYNDDISIKITINKNELDPPVTRTGAILKILASVLSTATSGTLGSHNDRIRTIKRDPFYILGQYFDNKANKGTKNGYDG